MITNVLTDAQLNRYLRSMYTNMTPEPRVNKLGHVVTKHVNKDKLVTPLRSGHALLSRLIPGVSRNAALDRKRLIRNLSSSVDQAFAEELSRIDDEHNIADADHSIDKSAENKNYSRMISYTRDSHRRSLAALRNYSDDTLNIIDNALRSSQHPSELLFTTFNRYGGVETRFRESVMYFESIAGQGSPNLLDHVRSAFAVDDLTTYENHEAVADAYAVAIGARRSRHEKMSNSAMTYEEVKAHLEAEDHILSERKQMTPELADVIVRHPGRADDIIVFMRERGDDPVEVDVEGLELYLNSASPILAEGTL